MMTEPAGIEALIAEEGLGPDYAAVVEGPLTLLAADICAARDAAGRPIVVGLCGAQGGGKSTTTKVLKLLLEAEGLRAAALSIDDLYLTHEARAELARRVHPVLAVRGVPGTHDPALGVALLDALMSASAESETALPRFDKALDTRAAEPETFRGRPDVVLFEGWCVGARPQEPEGLAQPVNALEAQRDREGVWRRHVNDQLAGPYRPLFDKIDRLVLLEAPDFSCVLKWRIEQEAKLRATARARGASSRVMTDEEIAVFIMHYERLTRHILAEMPGRCDVRLRLDAARTIVDYVRNDAAA